MAVFLPIIFVKDEAGQLFRDIAIATSISTALSLLVALTVVPMMASRLLRGASKDQATDASQGCWTLSSLAGWVGRSVLASLAVSPGCSAGWCDGSQSSSS